MNEFEWLRQTRELNQPVAPRNDLWARIDAAIDETAAPAEVAAPTPIKRARHRACMPFRQAPNPRQQKLRMSPTHHGNLTTHAWQAQRSN
jgi:hypothetical protein